MTPIAKMTEQELRVAVAEARGLKIRTIPSGELVYDTEGKMQPNRVPNYPTDANAAESLCNALAEQGWTARIVYNLSGCTVKFYREDETAFYGTAETLSIAIARAYLAVVQSQTPTT